MRRAIASLWRPVSGSARLAVARSLISAGLILAAVGGDVRAAVQDPVAQAPLAKGVAFLKQHAAEVRSPSHRILVAYALLKAEEPTSSPLIQEAATNISSRVQDGKFAPTGGQESIYSAGVEMMFLADLNANRYIDELHAASQYILEQQNSDGSWSYAKGGMGDTSITQYAILGLWSASRSGIDVPLDAWNRAAQWLIQTQMPDGGFAYTPGTNNGPEGGKSSPTMTPAAVGSLLVIRLHLYPEVKEFGARARQESGAREDKKLFGVLEAAESPEARPVSASEARSALGNAVPLAQLDGAIRRGLGWIAARFRPESTNTHKAYYHYTTERVGALINSDQFGPHNWYTSCRDNLISTQKPDGSWKDYEETEVATALEVLFLTRSTGKILKRENAYGSGLLQGGRGLPEDLSKAEFDGGEIKERKMEGPLDELLSELSKINPDNFEAAQAAIVEKVQIGDRSELLGQIDQIRKLITHSSPDVRRTAIWALGRSGDLRDANLLIKALQDNNVDVLVEAYNALCYLSRKISGVGLPSNPLDGLPVNPSQTQIDAAVNRWREEAVKRWTAWYLRIRPYEEKNDLFQLQFGSAARRN